MFTCGWKLVDPDSFVLGVDADRCGKVAQIRVLRPNRKTDLLLCEEHLNTFVAKWGLFNSVEILHNNWVEGTRPRYECYTRLWPCPHGSGCEFGDPLL